MGWGGGPIVRQAALQVDASQCSRSHQPEAPSPIGPPAPESKDPWAAWKPSTRTNGEASGAKEESSRGRRSRWGDVDPSKRLRKAAETNSTAGLDEALTAGADVLGGTDGDGKTAMHYAARGGACGAAASSCARLRVRAGGLL